MRNILNPDSPFAQTAILSELEASARSSAAEIRTLSSSFAIFAWSKTNTTTTVAELNQTSYATDGDQERQPAVIIDISLVILDHICTFSFNILILFDIFAVVLTFSNFRLCRQTHGIMVCFLLKNKNKNKHGMVVIKTLILRLYFS